MHNNPGNTDPLRKRLINEIFESTARRFDTLEEAKPLLDQAERLLGKLNAAGEEAGHWFAADVSLPADGKPAVDVIVGGPASVPDVLGTILRADLHYAECTPARTNSVAIRVQGYDVPVVVVNPILDCLEFVL